MTTNDQLNRARRAKALNSWMEECRSNLGRSHRFPEMQFEAQAWPLRSKYGAKMLDIKFAPTLAALSDLDYTYSSAIRGLAAEWVINGKVKHTHHFLIAWRLLLRVAPPSLFDLDHSHLRALEASIVQECEGKPFSAARSLAYLVYLSGFLNRLSQLGIVEGVAWSPSQITHGALKVLARRHQRTFKEGKASILDRQIEALNDATAAMLNGDPRLSQFDRAALACVGIQMCAPSRVNEPLCMSIHDVITVEDYAISAGEKDELGRAHMLLLQKGSKGSQWSAKPALNFMIAFLKYCMKVLIEGSERSRMLALWYEAHPDQIYLPDSIEHLRGQLIDRRALWQIMNLSSADASNANAANGREIFSELLAGGKVQNIPNPLAVVANGRKNSRSTLQVAAWPDLEAILLRRVHEALRTAKHVSPTNRYIGEVSNMLMLWDSETVPYLPTSIKYSSLAARFKPRVTANKRSVLTVFEKLGLEMVVGDRIETAWMDTHDPRRWLTDQALKAPERFSEALINKWANRVNIDNLKHYDFRNDIQKADQAAMPYVVEFEDLSAGLHKLDGLEAAFGLGTTIITANDAAISATTMEAIASAVEHRPIARTSNQLIVLYPSRFGACLHQHHETPCRSYSSCLTCHEHVVIKGHLPTNEEIRARDALLMRSIVHQLDRLATAHNRSIADLPEGLEDHMVTLIREGLSAEQMAEEMVKDFQEIKGRIKSVSLRLKLEEAFVAHGMVQRLDSPDIASGALISYHNPTRHAAPGHERSLDAHGGRLVIEAQLNSFHLEHAEFSPSNLGLKDQRDLLQPEQEEEERDVGCSD